MANTLKDNYRNYCRSNAIEFVFYQDWWLDAVCGTENWDVVLVEENNELIAYWPYYLKGGQLKKYIAMPKLTPSLGPVICKLPVNYSKSLSKQKQLLFAMADMLPATFYTRIKMHYANTNWQPLYWKGFSETTYYTYVIENIKNTDEVFKNFQTDIRTEIRKAEKQVTIKEGLQIQEFHKVVEKSFTRQNKKNAYSLSLLEKIDTACAERNCRKILYAEDANGQIHAAIYIVWDSFSAYYLMGGGDPALRNSGANSLLLWHAIQYVSPLTTRFDFEGSMLEPVERYVRAFGGKQTPYHIITKATPWVRALIESLTRFSE